MKFFSVLLFFICLFFSLNMQAQKEERKPLVIGEIRTVHSKILNEERTLNIYLPEKYNPAKSIQLFIYEMER